MHFFFINVREIYKQNTAVDNFNLIVVAGYKLVNLMLNCFIDNKFTGSREKVPFYLSD